MAKLTKDEILSAVEGMTVLELSDLVKALEEKFGVSAQAVVAPASAPQSEASGEVKEEQTVFNVVIAEQEQQKFLLLKQYVNFSQHWDLRMQRH